MTTMRELTINELESVSGGGTGSSSNNLSFREGLRGNPSTGWVKTGSNTLYLITVVGGALWTLRRRAADASIAPSLKSELRNARRAPKCGAQFRYERRAWLLRRDTLSGPTKRRNRERT